MEKENAAEDEVVTSPSSQRTACNASGPTHQQNLMGIDSPPGHQISVGGGDSVSPLGTQHVQYTGPVFNGSVSLIQSANIQTLNMSSPANHPVHTTPQQVTQQDTDAKPAHTSEKTLRRLDSASESHGKKLDQLCDLVATLKNLPENVDKVLKNEEDNRKNLDKVVENTKVIKTSQKRIESKFEVTETREEHLLKRTKEIEIGNKDIVEKITSLQQDKEKSLGQMSHFGEELGKVQGKVQDVHTQSMQNKETIQANSGKMEELQKSLLQVQMGVESTGALSMKHDEHIATVADKLTDVTKALRSMQIGIVGNTNEIKEATGIMRSTAAKFEDDHKQVDQNKQEIRGHEEKIGSLEQKISHNDTDPKSFNTTLFRRHGETLIDLVRVDGMLPQMVSCEAIDMREWSKIRKEDTEYDKVARLLAILDKKPNGVDLLRQALINSYQTHIAQMLE